LEITSTSLCVYFDIFLPEMTLNGVGIGHEGIGADGSSANGRSKLVYDRSVVLEYWHDWRLIGFTFEQL
jgi:hypothetical protein